jgi:ABC-2 type transport system permease protein
MPIVFTLFMGIAYGGAFRPTTADPRLRLAWVAASPETPLAQRLFERLAGSATVNPIRMTAAEARAALGKNEVAGLLNVPTGFGAEPSVDQPPLQLVADPAAASGQTVYRAVQLALTEWLSAAEIARLSVAAAPGADPAQTARIAFGQAWAAWGEQAVTGRVQIEQAVAVAPETPFGGNPYNQASPGILVQFAIFGLVSSAQILVQERKLRTLQRLLTTAMRPWEIVAGHMLAMFVVVFAQTALLVALGQLALGVDYLREAGATAVIAIALGLWVACLGLFIGVLARSDDQVVLYSMLAMFVFSALGGTWFSLEFSGGAFAALGRLLPSAWAMTGFQNIVIRGQGLASAWAPAGVLLAYALGFFGLAVWRFRKVMS